MSPDHRHRHPSRCATARRGALLILMVVALLLEGSQPLHLHVDDTPGFYNETHVLSSLARANGDAPLPGPAAATWVAIVAGKPLDPAAATVEAQNHSHTNPRAPPLR